MTYHHPYATKLNEHAHIENYIHVFCFMWLTYVFENHIFYQSTFKQV